MVASVRLDEWRSNNNANRALVRGIVMRAVGGGGRRNLLIDRSKDEVGYASLPDQDRSGFNVMASQARAIVEHWRFSEPTLRRDFELGHAPYSRVYSELKKL